MELKLKILEGRHAGQEMKIGKEKFLVGRSEECNLRPNSEKISRHHCVIMLAEGIATIRDLGSKNGTLVNGEKIVGEVELKGGDILEIGPLKFEVRPTVDIKREKKPVVKSVKEAIARTAETQSSDMDISDWLMDGNPKKSDDETMDFSKTDIKPKAPVTAAPAPPPAPAPAPEPVAEAPATDSPSKGGTGKLPPKPATTGGNSMNAAAEALKKLTQRR
jgi:hypothetical protein